MRLRAFTSRQPKPGVQTTSQKWKSDFQGIIKRHVLYVRACKSELEEPTFDDSQNETDKAKSPEITVRCG